MFNFLDSTKMMSERALTTIFQTALWNTFPWKKVCGFIKISLKFVLKSLTDIKPALVLATAWRGRGEDPLPEPMKTQANNTNKRQGRVNIFFVKI